MHGGGLPRVQGKCERNEQTERRFARGVRRGPVVGPGLNCTYSDQISRGKCDQIFTDVLIIFVSFCTAQSPFATENLLENLTTSRQATVFYQSYKSVFGYLKLFE